MESAVDVAVVGAGLAGLVAARDLRARGWEVTVLEARDRVGGRTWTVPGQGGALLDHGAQFVGPSQQRILALADDVGVPTHLCYGVGERYVSINGQADVDLTAVADAVEALERMARQVPLDAPGTAEHAWQWDAETFQTWLLRTVPGTVERATLRAITRAVFAAEADELSLLHVLTYLHSAGSMAALTQMDGGAQERRFVGGAQLIALRLAESLGSGGVRLRSPVRGIYQSRDQVRIEIENGDTVRARRVVVAVPIPLAGSIRFAPALPGRRAQLHQRMSPGMTIKLHCVYPTPFWRDAGHSGRMFADRGYVSVTFDSSGPDGTPGVLTGFVEGDAARSFAGLPADRRRAVVGEELTGVFGPRAASPLDYTECNWLDEEWTRGCYGANFGTGGWTRYGAALREPVGRIHWAGAETSTVWMNYMDGAVRSGERVAGEVAAALG